MVSMKRQSRRSTRGYAKFKSQGLVCMLVVVCCTFSFYVFRMSSPSKVSYVNTPSVAATSGTSVIAKDAPKLPVAPTRQAPDDSKRFRSISSYTKQDSAGALPMELTTASTSTSLSDVPKLPTHPKPKDFKKVTTIFSDARKDRSGAAILNYMMGHAFAMKYGMTYGGVCGNSTYKERQEELVAFLGLSIELPFGACPTNSTTHRLLPQFNYKAFNGTQILSKDWIRFIQSRMKRSILQKSEGLKDGIISVAVHVRRGDIKPCHRWRYLPDRHYLDILDRYVPKEANVTIYSDAKNKLYLRSFTERNYAVNIDGALPDVWRAMIQSDILITSKSDFSIVPAIVGRGRVLYTPFPDRSLYPLDHWEVIDKNISDYTEQFLASRCAF